MSDSKKLINIRITEKEKQRMEAIAGKCGLSLSEYLRKRGLGYEPKPLLDDMAFSLYAKLCKLSNLPLSPETEATLAALFHDLQDALFRPRKQNQEEIIKEVACWQQQDSGP